MNMPIKEKPVSRAEHKHRVLLYGEACTGKSFSIASIFQDAPSTTRVIFLMTERNAMEGLEAGLAHYKIYLKPNQLIYLFPEEKAQGFGNLLRAVENHAKESKVEALKGRADTTQGKEHYKFLQSVLRSLVSFSGTDYVTGETVQVGNVSQLTTRDILVIDGLSNIALEVWHSTVGDKLAISMMDYMQPQYVLSNLFAEFGRAIGGHFVLLAHCKEHRDENGALQGVVVDTKVGNANYESLMGNFTSVIYAYKMGTLYKWSGSKPKVYTLPRIIPAKDSLEPNFRTYGFFPQTQET